MIADDRCGPLETAIKMITAPAWVPIYFGVLGCRWLYQARKRKAEPVVEVLVPRSPSPWMPQTELERTVYAALVLAGEPVNNLKLAALMGVSPGECSRRVAQLEGVIRKSRRGREVLISLPH